MGRLHLWLGLASGLIVLIVSITGCLYVFQAEISEAYYHDKMFVTPAGTPRLPMSVLIQSAQRALGPDKPIESIVSSTAPDRAVEFLTYKGNDSALTYFGAITYFDFVYVNPYTGAVTGTVDYKHNFFNVVKFIHWSLLLNTKYGQPIVGYATLIFVIMLITGLILWWPKKWTKAIRQRNFKIKWKAGFKRVNYDLHNVPGFYALLPALLIALTGMGFAFNWFQGFVYAVAAGTTTPPPSVVVKSTVPAVDSTVMLHKTGSDSAVAGHLAAANAAETAKIEPIDAAIAESWRLTPGAKRLIIAPAEGKEGTIWVGGYRTKENYYGNDVMQYDQYTGKLLHRRLNGEKNAGEKLVESNYDIHVGAILGLPGKILAFLASLICASLPVTGFMIWWGRRHNKKPGRAVKSAQAEKVAKPLAKANVTA